MMKFMMVMKEWIEISKCFNIEPSFDEVYDCIHNDDIQDWIKISKCLNIQPSFDEVYDWLHNDEKHDCIHNDEKYEVYDWIHNDEVVEPFQPFNNTCTDQKTF